MNEIVEKEEIIIEDLIYEVRGKYVILDRDLAKLYQCTNGTKDINKAVKRNIERFPTQRGNNIKYLPYVLPSKVLLCLVPY